MQHKLEVLHLILTFFHSFLRTRLQSALTSLLKLFVKVFCFLFKSSIICILFVCVLFQWYKNFQHMQKTHTFWLLIHASLDDHLYQIATSIKHPQFILHILLFVLWQSLRALVMDQDPFSLSTLQTQNKRDCSSFKELTV